VVSDRLRFIYLSTAKNATSTLFALLSRQRCGGRVLARGDVPGQVWDEYFTFAFLSDPVDRLLRAYQEVSLRMERNELPQRAFAAMPEGMARFVSFLSDLEENGPFNEHVALQEAFVEGRRVDYWGRVETLREDLRRIFRHLGAEGAAPPPHRRQQTTHVIARADLDPRTIARIQELYRADYRLIAAVRPGDLAASPATPVRVSLDLADGTSHSFELPDDHPSLGDLLAHDPAQASASAQGLVQIPLDAGNTALTIAPRHVVRVAFNRPTPQRLEDTQSPPSPPRDHPRTGRLASAKHTHPFTNVDEAHLGGYVRSVSQPRMHLDATPHGDESTWYPRLWQWLVEELGVRSVLDVGCGEGHAAGFFRDAGCEVIGVDGSREARLDSVIPGDHVVHDFIEGPFVPDRSFDLVWSCEFVEHVDERFTHNFLASFAAGKRYLAMTFAPPGTGGWHHVNCRERSYWLDKMQRLGFEPDQALCDRARELAGHGHFSRTGEVFVRSPRRDRRVFVPGGGVPAAAPQSQDPLPIHPMEVARRGKSALYLFHDIFVHPTRATIVAVCPHYGDDWIPAEDGVDHDAVDLILGEQRVRGHCRRHRLDSWEPCMLLEFEAPEVAEAIASGPAVGFDIEVGPHRQHFEISSAPSPSFGVAMSLVVRDENRWIRGFLQYYLECVGADHVFVYDHDTAEREQLLRILEPYRRQGRVTYIPWNYQWRNDTDRKMTAQPAQEAHSLNRFANSRWLGFFDVDEFLRLPHTTLPDFLGRYDDAQVDGLSFGLRWFSYHGPLGFEGVENPLLTYLHKRPDPLGRKRQKLFIKGGSTRFARLHWLEEGKWELPIDDSEIYFHHYEHRPVRFEEAKQKPGEYDDYMLRFHDQRRRRPAVRRLGSSTSTRPSNPPRRGNRSWSRQCCRSTACAAATPDTSTTTSATSPAAATSRSAPTMARAPAPPSMPTTSPQSASTTGRSSAAGADASRSSYSASGGAARSR